ncbi:MAG TPA: pyruvate ferredoxin oxidoreductase, partial [Epsilonproteobacteria bacterium]|nr:pyruvate ferredoxin oxidoreductase [Campylobacterota bacterium]
MQDLKLKAADKRGIHQLGGDELVGWDEVTQGIILTSF